MLRSLLRASGVVVAIICLSGSVLALDATDISLLLKNGVEEAVVINLAREQGLSRPFTAQEVLQLNAAGASPRLLEFLTGSAVRTQADAPLAAAIPVAPAPLYSPVPSASCPPYVYPAPVYRVVRPGPTFYYGLGLSFGGGHGRRHFGGRRGWHRR